jgi:branched-chain amino acid transport system ATP-binding protein
VSALLRVAGLHAGYATASVLRGVDLEVSEGEIVALLGRNGMGKTTLLRAICGLQPPVVTEGAVLLAGERLTGLRSYQVARRGIGYVPQGRRIFASLTVDENLRVASRGAPDGWTVTRVYELFPRLAERRRQSGGTLSGGEQQMLAIGRALTTNPRLLVMDEPSEGLAPTLREVILACLRELRQTGQAVLVAEQNVDLALGAASTVAVLGESGSIEWAGKSTALMADEALLASLVGL